MIDIWWLIGALVLSSVTGMVTAVAILFIGGLGVLKALTKRLELVEISQENLDRRLVTEIKARASLKGVEARTVAKSTLQDARDRLSEEGSPARPTRPSVLMRR